ncbi:MAG: hypothetical protein L6R19_27650, partial [Alphaproteobacteria bacterium]|nr:hypothetical protein [Alphaproteobacteria bacterium]
MASELQLDPSDVARRPPRLSIDEMERQLAAAMPETEPSAGGMSAVAVDLLQRGLVKPATDLVTGYRAGAAGIYGTLANIAMLLNHAKDELAHVTGMGTPRAETHDPAVEAWLRRAARRMQPDSLPDDVGGKIYAGLGRAPADIAMYLAGTRALGPIFGMAGVEALREADKGPAAAATGAAKGALLGGTLKAAEKL